VYFIVSVIALQAAGTLDSLHGPKERPSEAHVSVPQNVQRVVKHSRWLPGTHTSQRRGHSEYVPAMQ